ncbi:MAG: undecaprenyl-diphosphate phosphatase [Rhodospirillales bacterium]|nr:undecaprenyl-diphosphate phosphatase [Rhodospirillales bacterium]
MPILHIAVLAVVQGITEFLPISSTAHLILVPVVAGWPDQGLTVDVAVHIGTLGAVMLYLWRDVWAMTLGLVQFAMGRRNPMAKLAGYLVVGTLPVVLVGFLLDRYAGGMMRNVTVIAWATLGFAVLLWIGDKLGMTVRRIEHLGLGDVVIIGLAQVLALIPGTSRAGITVTAARFLGLERQDSARFSMLLSIPVIVGAGSLKGWDLYQAGNAQLTADAFVAAALALVAAFVAIAAMMTWLRRASFAPFVVYRIILGGLLLAVVYGWVG